MRLFARLASPRAALLADVYYMPAVRDLSDLRWIAYAAIDLPVIGGLSGRVAIDASRETAIVVGTAHDDLSITFGIALHEHAP